LALVPDVSTYAELFPFGFLDTTWIVPSLNLIRLPRGFFGIA
jgi:hypothetical protein